MVFSYTVDELILLEKVFIPIEENSLIILTGIENRSFSLLGGILSGLLPLPAEKTVPNVDELVKYFTGNLKILKGNIPENAVYLGPDPEKHLFFSKVKEELYAQTYNHSKNKDILESFGLSLRFIRRKISSLSGGEKMKLALGIVFSKEYDCFVFHGIMPWLDKDGKNAFLKKIENLLSCGKSVILLEQEIHYFKNYLNKLLYFDGRNTKSFSVDYTIKLRKSIKLLSANLSRPLKKTESIKEILRFDSVFFKYNDIPDDEYLLNNVNFIMKKAGFYCLVGDNGTGKSTIAKLILKLLKPEKGNIFFSGRSLCKTDRAELVSKISYLGQFPEQQITLSSVKQYIEYSEKRMNSLSKTLLIKYFPSVEDYPVSVLSPLELKLLAIISSISSKTEFIILDEPTWGIDLNGEVTLINLLLDIKNKLNDISVLTISHDLSFLNMLNVSVLFLDDSNIKEFKSIASLLSSNICKDHFSTLYKKVL